RNGNIQIKEGLNENEKIKAKLTLSAFNLNGDSKLVNSRSAAIKPYIKEADEIYSLIESDENALEIIKVLIDEKIQEISSQPFSTALIHLFQYNQY
ncbi:hypothetical protein, partial [Acinetobacter baumannii]